MDLLGFVDGPAEVVLLTSGLPEPFPAATEHRLFSLLIQRAKTHLARIPLLRVGSILRIGRRRLRIGL
jgi:hypothetical protein